MAYNAEKKLYLQRFGRKKCLFLHKSNHPNLRSGPIIAVLIQSFSLMAITKSSPYPLECFLQSKTKIEPDLSLKSPIPHLFPFVSNSL